VKEKNISRHAVPAVVMYGIVYNCTCNDVTVRLIAVCTCTVDKRSISRPICTLQWMTWFPVNLLGSCQNRLSRSRCTSEKRSNRISFDVKSAVTPPVICSVRRRVVRRNSWSSE